MDRAQSILLQCNLDIGQYCVVSGTHRTQIHGKKEFLRSFMESEFAINLDAPCGNRMLGRTVGMKPPVFHQYLGSLYETVIY